MSKNLKLVKRIAAVATAVCVVAGMMVSASAYGITEPSGGFVYDGSEASVTVPVTGTNSSGQVTIVVRKDNDDWLTDPNNNVVYIDQVTGAEGSTSIVFGIDNKWLGADKAGEYTIFVGGSSQDVTTAKLTISGEPIEKVTLVSIAVSDAKTEYKVGDSFVAPTVTATYSDGSTKTVAATFTGYDMAAAGTQTVTATYEGVTATYEITVEEEEVIVPPVVEGDYIFDAEVYDEAFEEDDKTIVEVTLSADNHGIKAVMFGTTELYYSVQNNVYVGLVDTDAIGDDVITGLEIVDAEPTILVYGNVDGDYEYDEIEEAVDASDLQFLKKYAKNQLALEARELYAADVDGDGLADASDLQILKRYLKSNGTLKFGVLK